MKSALEFRRELLLLSLPIVLMMGIALHFQKLNSVSGRLVGTWQAGSSTFESARITFKANGEFESGPHDTTVFKGRYADSGHTFRTYNIKRYIRNNGVDSLVEGCDKGTEAACSENHEATDMDKELSKPKYFSTIVSADWETGVLKVRSPVVGPYGGEVSTWRRQ